MIKGMSLHKKIRHILETTPGLTQRGLAQCMGLNPAAVNRMLYGRRNIMAEEIPVIQRYLGVSLDVGLVAEKADPEYRQAARVSRGFSDVGGRGIGEENASYVPVYAAPLPSTAAVDWAARHPAQFGVPDAFAFYVVEEDMEPRYFRGELVYLHPHRPPETSKDCVIALKDGSAVVRRLADSRGKNIRVLQFNPRKEKEIPEKDIAAIYAIVGRG